MIDPQGRSRTDESKGVFVAGATEGTYRTRTLESTLDSLWERRQEFGVRRVSDITQLDRSGLPVFVAVRPDAHPRNLTVSAGKGVERLASLVSCLAEAFERHWAEPQHHDYRRATADELEEAGDLWLSPAAIGTVRGSRWTPATELNWLSFRDLGCEDREVFVPAEYAVAPYVPTSGSRLTTSSSDGIAAGNTPEEAALHALMELIERDACSYGNWMHRGHRLIRDSLPDSANALLETFEAADLEATVYQFGAVLGIPVIYVTLDDHRTTNSMLLCAGAGAHIDGDVAITRALTEAAQSRVCAISGGREDLAPKYLDNRALGYDRARASLASWDRNFEDAPYRRWGEITSLDTAEQALTEIVDGLLGFGLPQVLIRELAPPDQPLSVVSAVVPGLECVEGPDSPAGPRFRAAMLEHAMGIQTQREKRDR